MGIRASIGFTAYRLEDLEPNAREALASWRGCEGERPVFIEPHMVNGLVSYLLDRAESGPCNDRRFSLLRQQLLASARVFRTSDGKDLIVFEKDVESFVLARLAELAKEDRRDLLSLALPLSQAEASIREDGELTGDAQAAVSAWPKAADALDGFLSKPRCSVRFGLDDMLGSIDGLHALIDILELYRRLLLAAGCALDALGDATIGHRDVRGLEDAICMWHISRGDAARRIGSALKGLVARTPGIDIEMALPDSILDDGTWILPFSRLGQQIVAWALKQEVATLNFAAVGAAWPGPAIYGYDDGEEEPVAACKLLAELSRGGKGPGDILFGSVEAAVSDDLSVVVPPHLLEGDRRVYVARRFDEYGAYLICVGESRRTSLLAKLIVDEQGFEGCAGDYAGNGETGGVVDDCSADFDDTFALLAIEGGFIELDERGRLPLGDTGFDGLEPGAHLSIGGNGETFFIADSEQEKRRSSQAEEDLSELYFEG